MSTHAPRFARSLRGPIRHSLRTAALVLALGIGLAVAHAQESTEAPTHVSTAAAVVAAESKDAEALAKIVDESRIDPWLVVEQLCAEGHAKLAVALAGHVTVPKRDALIAYATRLAETPTPSAIVETWGRYQETYAARDATAALALDIPAGADASIAGIEAQRFRVGALVAKQRFDEAKTLRERVVRAAEELGWVEGVVQMKLDTADAYGNRRDLPSAVRLATEARARADEAGDLRIRAAAAKALGSLLERAQRHMDAIEQYEVCLADARAAGDGQWHAIFTRAQARCLNAAGHYADALARMDEAMELFRAIGHRQGESYCLNDGAISLQYLGDLDGAAARYRRAQEMFVELGDRGSQANSLNNLALIEKFRGDFRDCLEHFGRAREIFRELGSKGHEGNALGNVALTHVELGNHGLAVELLGQLRELREQTNDLGGRIEVESYLAFAYGRVSMPGPQTTHLERALELASTTQAFAKIAALTYELAQAYRYNGRLDAAQARGERALALYRKLGDRKGEAKALRGLAELHFIRDCEAGPSAVARVREHLDEAIRAADAVGDTNAQARLIFHHGYLHHFADEDQAAVDRLMEGIELIRAHTGDDQVPSAMAWIYVGVSQERLGRDDEARAAYERAVEILDGSDRNRAAVGTAEAKLAHLDLRAGDAPSAVRRLRTAVELSIQDAQGLDTISALHRQETLDGTWLAAIDVATQVGDPELILWIVEQSSGVGLARALGSRGAIEEAAVAPELLQALNLARHEQSQAAAALQRATESKKLAEVRAAREAVAEKDAALDLLTARYRREATAAATIVEPEPIALSEVESSLGPGTVMVHLIPRTTGVAALVIRGSGSSMVPLDVVGDLGALVDRVLLESDPYVDEKALPDLRQRLAEPLGITKEDRTVLIAPRGRLAFLPYAALFPEHDVALVPSATVHRLLRADAGLRGEGVLAVGDPDYGGVDSVVAAARGIERGRLLPLPGTRVEAEAVGTKVLLGKNATEANFRSALSSRPRWRSIHLACHGLVDTDRPQFSSLAITPGGGDDGFLSCLDLYALAARADLAVLSACETGRGKVYVTEGVVGLAGAFMQSGTPRVICSQWKVDDEATQVLMKRFYELWNPDQPDTGLSPARALRLAQQHVREQERFAHPKFWAAWVLWGLPE